MARKTAAVAHRPTVKQIEPTSYSPVQQQAWPDAWAVALRLEVDGHRFDLTGREYLRAVMRDESESIVIPKGAQLGFTTAFLTRTFHWLIKRKWHHLYLLPLKAGSIPFVQGRVNPILRSNASIERQFQNVENRTHKQTTEDINLYIRGTNIWTELREVPSDILILDEYDKAIPDYLPEAYARLDGSKIGRVTLLSTPTAPGHGVYSDDQWDESDQHRWHVRCPFCDRAQVFSWEENVKPDTDDIQKSVVECAFCRKVLDDDARAEMNATGIWIPDKPGAPKRGYHLNQLNSPTKSLTSGPTAIMLQYREAQSDAVELRAFMNNVLGLPYVAPGDKLTPDILDRCIGKGHRLGGIPGGTVYVGVDVGHDVMHVSASYKDRYERRVKWAMFICHEWSEIDRFLSSLVSFIAVIDAQPDKRDARDLSVKYGDRVWVGYADDRMQQPEQAVFMPRKYGEVGKVNIDKTMALDNVVWSYMQGRTILPADARQIGEHMPKLDFNGFYHQMTQMVRVAEPDIRNNLVGKWKKNTNPDHWHHADMFEIVAMQRETELYVPAGVGAMLQGSVMR